MNATTVNVVGVVLVVAASAFAGARAGRGAGEAATASPAEAEAAKGTVPDARGKTFPARDYRRIVSASTTSDRILLDLVEPDRVLALSEHGAQHSSQRHRYAGRRTVHSLDELETILSWGPDLVIASGWGDPRRVARLEEAGIPVFDLGQQRGLASLLEQVRTVTRLLAVPERGEAYARALEARMARVACDGGRRPTALYVAPWGGSLFGGTRPSSFHDVLTAAGLEDVAARAWSGFPQYTAEDLLRLDPEVVVTREGLAAVLCERPGLAALRACREGRVIELPGGLVEDPGPAMLEAAELLRDKLEHR